MLAKLCVLIVSVGVCGSTLLTIRQSRIQAAHELAKSRLRIIEQERQLQVVRARLAALTRPDVLVVALDTAEDFRPVLEDECPPEASAESFVLLPSEPGS